MAKLTDDERCRKAEERLAKGSGLTNAERIKVSRDAGSAHPAGPELRQRLPGGAAGAGPSPPPRARR